MNSFEQIFRANPELIEALSHARDKTQRLPRIDGVNEDSLVKRWSQVKGIADHQHRLTRFNIFTALNAMDYETRHSNFLASLLDPNGTKFLNGFLSLMAKKMPKKSEATKLDSILRSGDALQGAEVVREFKRADLLLVDRTLRFVCLVENKIHTGEHSEQLTRYRRMVEQEFPGYQQLFVFLTLIFLAKLAKASSGTSVSYFGTVGTKGFTLKSVSNVPTGKVKFLSLSNSHNCCKQCGIALKKAVKAELDSLAGEVKESKAHPTEQLQAALTDG